MTLTAALNAPSGHGPSINLSDGSTTLATCTIDVWIRPASALRGVSGESTLTVNEGVTTQVAVNLTNVGSEPEDVHFTSIPPAIGRRPERGQG